MSVPMINIDQLHREREDRITRKKMVYDKILEKCHHRILTAAKNDSSCFCFYIVPSFIYGMPLYNLNTCIMYLVNCLTKNGFDVKYTHPNLIYISWYNKKNPKAIKYKPNKPIGEEKTFKKIDEYKPSGNFIYDEESVNLLSNKAFKLLED